MELLALGKTRLTVDGDARWVNADVEKRLSSVTIKFVDTPSLRVAMLHRQLFPESGTTERGDDV
jgi:hypothetical protein